MSARKESTGISFTGALLLLFVGLKLAGVIDWSWWWVLSPFWIPLAIALVAALIYWRLSRT